MRPASNPFKPTQLSTELYLAARKENTKPKFSPLVPTSKPPKGTCSASTTASSRYYRQLPHLEPGMPQTMNKFLDFPKEIRDLIIETAVTDPLGNGFTFRRCGRAYHLCITTPADQTHFCLHFPGQVRRRKALQTFKNLRAVCRQLRDATDDIFFLQNEFDTSVTRMQDLTWVSESPSACWYLSKVRNFTVQSWPMNQGGMTKVGHVRVRLCLTKGRWSAKASVKPVIVAAGISEASLPFAEEVAREAELGIDLLVKRKLIDEPLGWDDIQGLVDIMLKADEAVKDGSNVDWNLAVRKGKKD